MVKVTTSVVSDNASNCGGLESFLAVEKCSVLAPEQLTSVKLPKPWSCWMRFG